MYKSSFVAGDEVAPIEIQLNEYFTDSIKNENKLWPLHSNTLI